MLNIPREGITTIAPLPPPVDPGWNGRQPERGSSDSLPGFGEFVPFDEHPEPIEQVPPEYPQAARRAGIQGIVTVAGVVERDGSITRLSVMRSVPGLDQAALDCVAKWRFKPAMSGGEPVPALIAIPVRFRL